MATTAVIIPCEDKQKAFDAAAAAFNAAATALNQAGVDLVFCLGQNYPIGGAWQAGSSGSAALDMVKLSRSALTKSLSDAIAAAGKEHRCIQVGYQNLKAGL